jgi:hypothetical protein
MHRRTGLKLPVEPLTDTEAQALIEDAQFRG